MPKLKASPSLPQPPPPPSAHSSTNSILRYFQSTPDTTIVLSPSSIPAMKQSACNPETLNQSTSMQQTSEIIVLLSKTSPLVESPHAELKSEPHESDVNSAMDLSATIVKKTRKSITTATKTKSMPLPVHSIKGTRKKLQFQQMATNTVDSPLSSNLSKSMDENNNTHTGAVYYENSPFLSYVNSSTSAPTSRLTGKGRTAKPPMSNQEYVDRVSPSKTKPVPVINFSKNDQCQTYVGNFDPFNESGYLNIAMLLSTHAYHK